MKHRSVLCTGMLFLSLNLYSQTYLDSTATIDDRVQDLLSRMTLDEKIGQMTQADRGKLKSSEDIKTYYLGSILSGGGSVPSQNTPEGWADMVDGFQTKALETRLGIPIIYGIDAVHGHNNVIGAVIFPHNIGMGCTWNPELVREAARITALEVAGTGIRWTFAPCIAVPQDERWGRTYEGFGETAEITMLMSEAAVKGFQGDSLGGRGSVAACAKHYVGDGGTDGGIDQGNTKVDELTLRTVHLPGYVRAINAGVSTVMPSFSSWNGTKMHGNSYLLTDVLKTELGFKGFVVSDWNGIDQIDGDYEIAVKKAVNAGIDMAMAPGTFSAFFTTLNKLVNEGSVSQDRIDDAVSRILRVKFMLGLFEHPFPDRSLTDSVGSAEHRLVARQCVRESMVLLKKENGILPLSKSAGKIGVAGSKADNIGYQCGGWTISWQGSGGDITPGTTILQAIENACDGATVVFSEDGSGLEDAEVAVMVIGEKPYAEGQGDREDLKLASEEIETVRRVKEAGIPVVVILISGRPMILDTILHYADVLFAAWLPGTEGDGIADILFGDKEPSGLLTHSWPRSMSQIPINIAYDIPVEAIGKEKPEAGIPVELRSTEYRPLYPYKHGITSLADDGPDVPPVFQSALLSRNGKIVEAAFSKPMADPGEEAQFEVRVNGLSAAVSDVGLKSSDPNTLEIELLNSANAGDSLTLYLISGISAVDGSGLEPFGPEDIYNLRNEGSGEQAIPGRVEAENYSSMSGVSFEQTSDAGGGNNLTSIDATDWVEYDLLVPDSGAYQVDLRVAAESRVARVGFVNNGKALVIFDLPVTGSGQTWQTVTTEITLNSGLQKVKLFAFIGGFNLNWMDFSFLSSVNPVSVPPAAFHMGQNYPNPFNIETTLMYSLPLCSRVKITVYNLQGHEVEKFVSEMQDPGEHRLVWNAEGIPSGVYMVKLEAGDFTSMKKVVLLK